MTMKFCQRAIAFSLAIAFCHAQDIVQQLLDQLKDIRSQSRLNNGSLSISPALDAVVTNIISRGMIHMALELDRTISANQSHQENVLLSPSCLQITLATILLGSRGKTFQEIIKSLSFDDPILSGHKEVIHLVLSMKLKNYKWKQSHADFHPLVECFPALFMQRTYPLTEAFQTASKQLYSNEIVSVDFSQNRKNVKDAINNWVQKKTKNRVQNAVYALPHPSDKIDVSSVWSFKGDWFEKFQKYPTRVHFTTGANESLFVDMIYQENNFPFYDDDELDLRVLGIPYRGFEVMMYLILPKSDDVTALQKVKQNLTDEKIDELITKLDQRRVFLCFPKMKLSSSSNLRRALEHLGILSLFDPETADLGLMSPGSLEPPPENPSQTFSSSPIDSNLMQTKSGEMDPESLDRIRDNKLPERDITSPSPTTQGPSHNGSTSQHKSQIKESDDNIPENESIHPTSPPSPPAFVPPPESPSNQITEEYSPSFKETRPTPSKPDLFSFVSPSYSHTRVYSPSRSSTIAPPTFRNVPPCPLLQSTPKESPILSGMMTKSLSAIPSTTTITPPSTTTEASTPSPRVKTTSTEFPKETVRKMKPIQSSTHKQSSKHNKTNVPRLRIPTTTRKSTRLGTTKATERSTTKPKTFKTPAHTQPLQFTYEYPNGNRPNFAWKRHPLDMDASTSIQTPKATHDSFGAQDATPPLEFPPIVEVDSNTDEYIQDGSYRFEDPCNIYVYEQWPYAVKWQRIPRCRRNVESVSGIAGIDMVRDRTETSNPGLYVRDFIHVVDMSVDDNGNDVETPRNPEARPVHASPDSEYFIVSKPFLMLVTHNPSKTVLFWGSINQPSPSYHQP